MTAKIFGLIYRHLMIQIIFIHQLVLHRQTSIILGIYLVTHKQKQKYCHVTNLVH